MKQSSTRIFLQGKPWFVLTTLTGLAFFGCGPEGNGSSESTSSSSSSSSSSGSSSSSSSSGSSSSSSGSGGGGGGGGGGTACIDPMTYADLLSIKDSAFCVVASYTADDASGGITWGRHGGPVFATQGMNGMISITRLQPPMGASGKMTADVKNVNIGLPNGSFLGGQAIDLPFFNWTAVSYTNVDPMTSGEVILLDGTTVGPKYPANGFFSGVGIGTSDAQGRIVYSGLSAINDSTGQTSALYASDTCGAAGNKPRLIPDGDATCKDAISIETFGDASGPVTADHAGNVFAIMSKASSQDIRGYAASTVAHGKGPATGTPLFKVPGYSGSFAAIGPDAAGTGVVVFQAIDATTFAYVDPVAQRFNVTGGTMTPQGVSGVFMTAATAGTALNFTADDQGRLWIAIKKSATEYAVLVAERKN